MRILVVLSVAMGLAVATPGTVLATIYVGGDYAGGSLLLSNGDVLNGTFTNVNRLLIPLGATVKVQAGTPLTVQAQLVDIFGTLDASGAGYSGGAGGPHDGAGLPGSGLGAGAGGLPGGSVHASGGGGGAYGGNGGRSSSWQGTSPGPAAGGAAYGSATTPDILMGSGGGGAGSHMNTYYAIGGAGGAGGGAVSVSAAVMHLTGSILADGRNGAFGIGSLYSASGGGGGAGGGILLSGELHLAGLLSAKGANGANYSATGSPGYAQGGGGGGGGRIKLFGPAEFNSSFAYSIYGGTPGLGSLTGGGMAATGGASGTFLNNTTPIPEPLTMLGLALGVGGIGLHLRRRGTR